MSTPTSIRVGELVTAMRAGKEASYAPALASVASSHRPEELLAAFTAADCAPIEVAIAAGNAEALGHPVPLCLKRLLSERIDRVVNEIALLLMPELAL